MIQDLSIVSGSLRLTPDHSSSMSVYVNEFVVLLQMDVDKVTMWLCLHQMPEQVDALTRLPFATMRYWLVMLMPRWRCKAWI